MYCLGLQVDKGMIVAGFKDLLKSEQSNHQEAIEAKEALYEGAIMVQQYEEEMKAKDDQHDEEMKAKKKEFNDQQEQLFQKMDGKMTAAISEERRLKKEALFEAEKTKVCVVVIFVLIVYGTDVLTAEGGCGEDQAGGTGYER